MFRYFRIFLREFCVEKEGGFAAGEGHAAGSRGLRIGRLGRRAPAPSRATHLGGAGRLDGEVCLLQRPPTYRVFLLSPTYQAPSFLFSVLFFSSDRSIHTGEKERSQAQGFRPRLNGAPSRPADIIEQTQKAKSLLEHDRRRREARRLRALASKTAARLERSRPAVSAAKACDLSWRSFGQAK